MPTHVADAGAATEGGKVNPSFPDPDAPSARQETPATPLPPGTPPPPQEEQSPRPADRFDPDLPSPRAAAKDGSDPSGVQEGWRPTTTRQSGSPASPHSWPIRAVRPRLSRGRGCEAPMLQCGTMFGLFDTFWTFLVEPFANGFGMDTICYLAM